MPTSGHDPLISESQETEWETKAHTLKTPQISKSLQCFAGHIHLANIGRVFEKPHLSKELSQMAPMISQTPHRTLQSPRTQTRMSWMGPLRHTLQNNSPFGPRSLHVYSFQISRMCQICQDPFKKRMVAFQYNVLTLKINAEKSIMAKHQNFLQQHP